MVLLALTDGGKPSYDHNLAAQIAQLGAHCFGCTPKLLVRVVERIITGEKYSIMFNKDDALATEVNAVLTTLKGEGFIAGLHEKWFGAKPEDTTSTVMVTDMPKAK